VPHEAQGQNLAEFPHLQRWFEAIRVRPATVRAYDIAKRFDTTPVVTEASRKVLFGQTAESVSTKT
jgi:GST-like protein